MLSYSFIIFRPIGMPYVFDVTVINPSKENNIQLHSFSGENPLFHVSFSKSQVYVSHKIELMGTSKQQLYEITTV